jgi:hypothetical protein
MKKFLVLYKASKADFEKAMQSTPDQQKAGMDAWMTWSKRVGSSIVDMGGPLGKAQRFTPEGNAALSNDLGGYSVLQAESAEAVAGLLKGHPHFMMGPSSTIEVTEILAIPGM